MNIEDYTIDTSAFAGFGNAATAASINLSNFADEISNTIFKLSDNGVTVFDNNGNLIIRLPGQIKVVFDNGIQITDESEVDYVGDLEPATDEEIKTLIGIK